MECEICIKPEGEIKQLKTYQAGKKEYEIHYVCEKCINKLVSNHFSLINVPW